MALNAWPIKGPNASGRQRRSDDAEMCEYVRKAVWSSDMACKAKHINGVMYYTVCYQTTTPVWQALKAKASTWQHEPVAVYKAMTLIHRMLIEGPPPITLQQALGERHFIRELIRAQGGSDGAAAHGKTPLARKGYGVLIDHMGAYLLRKLDLHDKTGTAAELPPSYAYTDYDAIQCLNNDPNGARSHDIVRAFMDELDRMTRLVGVILREGNGSECKLAPLQAMVPETYGLYKYVCSLLTLVHMCSDRLQMALIEVYEQRHHDVRRVLEGVAAVPLLKKIMKCPQIPKEPVTFECFNPDKVVVRDVEHTIQAPKAIEPAPPATTTAVYDKRVVHERMKEQEEEDSDGSSEEEDDVREIMAENKKLRRQIRTFHHQAKEWREQVVAERTELSAQIASQAEELESLRAIVQTLRDKYAEVSRARQLLQADNAALLERIAQLERKQIEPAPTDPFESVLVEENHLADAVTDEDHLTDLTGDVLEDTWRFIEAIARRMLADKPTSGDGQLAQAVASLLQRAIPVQRAIVKHSGQPDVAAFYLRNSVWSDGVKSAAQHLCHYVQVLGRQEDMVEGVEEGKRIVAAQQLNAGCVQLVAAARVKFPTALASEEERAGLERLLEAAAHVSHLCKQQSDDTSTNSGTSNTAITSATTTTAAKDVEVVEDDVARKIHEMDLHVDILQRERDLQAARAKLARLRQQAYAPPSQPDGGGDKQAQPERPPTVPVQPNQ